MPLLSFKEMKELVLQDLERMNNTQDIENSVGHEIKDLWPPRQIFSQYLVLGSGALLKGLAACTLFSITNRILSYSGSSLYPFPNYHKLGAFKQHKARTLTSRCEQVCSSSCLQHQGKPLGCQCAAHSLLHHYQSSVHLPMSLSMHHDL